MHQRLELQHTKETKKKNSSLIALSHSLLCVLSGGSAPCSVRLKKRNMGDVPSLDVEIKQEETTVYIKSEPEDRPEETTNGVKT